MNRAHTALPVRRFQAWLSRAWRRIKTIRKPRGGQITIPYFLRQPGEDWQDIEPSEPIFHPSGRRRPVFEPGPLPGFLRTPPDS